MDAKKRVQSQMGRKEIDPSGVGGVKMVKVFNKILKEVIKL